MKKEVEFPDRRKHGYVDLETRVDRHMSDIDARFRKRYRGMLIAFAVIGLCSAVALYGFGVVLREQGKQQERIKVLALSNRNLVRDIQHQRETSIRENCVQQNKRHDDTTNALIKAAAADEDRRATRAGKLEVRRRRDVTLGLIDALSPKQDCESIVRIALGKETP